MSNNPSWVAAGAEPGNICASTGAIIPWPEVLSRSTHPGVTEKLKIKLYTSSVYPYNLSFWDKHLTLGLNKIWVLKNSSKVLYRFLSQTNLTFLRTKRIETYNLQL